MSASPRSSDVVVGLVTENTPRLLTQAIRLVRSIRWLGGSLAGSRVVVCGVGPLEADARATLEQLGAELRTVSRFHPASPTGNRQPLLAELLDAPEKLLLLLDCDTLVVRDPLPHLRDDVFQGKIAPTPTVSDEVFTRLFAHFGLPKPPRSHVTGLDRQPTIPYFNAGVLAIPTALARTLAPSWRRFNQILADAPELVAPCHRHLHQAALSLALAETRIPCAELPVTMNMQLNTQHLPAPPGFGELDPVIIHYHQLATDDGYLLPCSYAGAQARIETFHERMRSEGFAPATRTTTSGDSRAVVVLGMHRSGTSVITEVLHAMGCHAGDPDELTAPDIFNPTGYWEHKQAVALDVDILTALGGDWVERIEAADVSRLDATQRAEFVERARAVGHLLRRRRSFVVKDPRMSLLFPIWREALAEPVCVIAWRHPLAVARSLVTRNGRPMLHSLAAWDHHYRSILRDSEGLTRILVSYEELLADPARVVRGLFDELTRLGIDDLTLPSDQRLHQIVQPDFNRSGRAPEVTLLDPDQRALLESLQSGAAVRGPVAPTSARAFALLADYEAAAARESRLRADLDAFDAILGAVFQSRSWRLGHRLTGLVRSLLGSRELSAVDRWQEIRLRWQKDR